MHLEDFVYEKRDGIGQVTFNRPERLNACRVFTYRELLAILDDLRADPSVRVVVITGAGRAFCAGDDLKEMDDLVREAPSLKLWRDLAATLQEITRRVVALPQPVIAAVNGYAIGFGAELSIASDIRVAADGATFMFTEVTRGLYVTNGVLYLLPRLVGHGRAAEWLMSGGPISATDALAAGLVTRLVPRERLVESALALAARLRDNAPIPLRLLKRHLRRAQNLDLEAVLDLEADGLMECLASDDLAEGMRAFVEKRAPRYTGR